MDAKPKWQSLAALQQERAAEIEPAPAAAPEPPEPPDTINDTGRAAVDLLRRWRAHNSDEGAALTTLLAVYGTQSTLGRMLVRWVANPVPVHVWLAEIAHANGARLADVGPAPARSAAAAEMIKRRIVRRSGVSKGHRKRLETMDFRAHAALLAYWRERRELLHVLRAILHGSNALRAARAFHGVENLVRQLEESNVRIMSR
jgi:hypothetical protein